MPGIVAHAASIPRIRLPRSVIAEQWGLSALPGERSVANFDEDSLTLAVDASLAALNAHVAPELDGVFFVSTSSPYAEKLVAATLASVLDTASDVRTLDFCDSLRAASGAVLTAIDLIASGTNERILVAAGEVRPAMPDSIAEQNAGDAGAAVILGGGGVEVVARSTLSAEFYGTWRTDTESYPRTFPGGLDAKLGHGRMLPQVLGQLLSEARLSPEAISRAVICGVNPRAAMKAASSVGIDPHKQLQDTLWLGIGECGAAQPLVLLSAALEKASPGDLILWAVYGDGADSVLFRVGEAGVPAPARGVEQQIEIKRLLSAYGKYARWRKLFKRDYIDLESSSAAVLVRDRKAMLSLFGGLCPKCDALQFPINRVCIRCAYAEGLEEKLLPRSGRIFTYYQNHVVPHPDPPVIEAVIDLEGGTRFFTQMTDVDPDDVEIDMPIELVFRRHHDAGGLHNYFWKARPRR